MQYFLSTRVWVREWDEGDDTLRNLGVDKKEGKLVIAVPYKEFSKEFHSCIKDYNK